MACLPKFGVLEDEKNRNRREIDESKSTLKPFRSFKIELEEKVKENLRLDI